LFVIFHIHVYPNSPRKPEEPDEQNGEHHEQQPKGSIDGEVSEPKQTAYKSKAKESRDNIGDEHRSVVEAGTEEIFLPTLGAGFGHIEGLAKGKGASGKEVTFVATGTFKVDYAICFRAFFEHAIFG
jgi:hypothetical protein